MRKAKTVNEYERKFLCYKLPEHLSFASISLITQYYLPDNRRFRIRSSDMTKAPQSYELIKKEEQSEGYKTEVEYDLDRRERDNLIKECLKNNYPSVTKRRYVHIDEGIVYEFDVFVDLNDMVVLEIETKTFNQDIEISKEVKKYIICEVTDKKEFNNKNLADAIQNFIQGTEH